MSKYDQARADYERMRELMAPGVGKAQVYDFTGGFVFEEHGMNLMEKPTKAMAASIYESLLIYGFQAGWDNNASDQRIMPDLNDPEIAEIAERYGFEL